MTTLADALPDAISELTCYCGKEKTRFIIRRVGLRFNPVSEKSEMFNKWIVTKAPEKPMSQFLTQDALRWIDSFVIAYPADYITANLMHDTLEDAFNALSRVIGDSLSFDINGEIAHA